MHRPNKKYVCQSYQLDSYLLFLERGIRDLLPLGGYLGMIIPNPWLTNLLQQNTRRFVTQNTRMLEIVHFLFPVFPAVTVDTEIVILQKESPEHCIVKVTVAKTQEAFELFRLGQGISRIEHDQDAWRALNGGVINIFLTKADSKLASKIASKSVALSSLFEINVGIKPYQRVFGNSEQPIGCKSIALKKWSDQFVADKRWLLR